MFCTGGGATPPKDAGPGWMQKSSDAVANGYSAARRSASQATGLEEGTHWFEGLLLVVVLLCCCRKYYQRRQANAAPSWTKCEPLAFFSLCSMTMLWQCPLTSARLLAGPRRRFGTRPWATKTRWWTTRRRL